MTRISKTSQTLPISFYSHSFFFLGLTEKNNTMDQFQNAEELGMPMKTENISIPGATKFEIQFLDFNLKIGVFKCPQLLLKPLLINPVTNQVTKEQTQQNMGVTTDPFTNAHANRNKGGGAGNIV